jgi:head-tail adaptor
MWNYQSMQHCIRLLQQKLKYDDYGDASENWIDVGRYWAKILPKASATSKPTYEVTIRHPKMKIDRVEWDGKMYRIMGPIEEDARKTWRRFFITEV